MSLEESQFINSVFSDNECRLSLTRTKSTSIPNHITSQQSLQTLINLDDAKLNKRESSRVFNNHYIESMESQETSFDYASLQQLESQIFVQRDKEKEGVKQMSLLKDELDSFIGLLQRVKTPQEELISDGKFRQNLSVIISTDESQTSKQSPAQDYYSFTNQISGTSRISQIQSMEDQQLDNEQQHLRSEVIFEQSSFKNQDPYDQKSIQFQNMVDQKREIIQEGFKRCIQALSTICKKYEIAEALPWLDKLATIQIIIIQQGLQMERCIQILQVNETKFVPQIQALKECLNQQEKELDLNQKQNQQKARYENNLEQELKNLYSEQSQERQQIVELQQKNFQLKNLILLANRQYEDLVLKLSLSEKKSQFQQNTHQEQTKQLLQSNKVLRNVIIATGDEKAEQVVNALLQMVGKKQSQNIESEGRQKSEGPSRQKSDSLGRSTKENVKDSKKKIPIVNKTTHYGESHRSPLSTLRGKISEFHSGKKSQNRGIR